MDGGGKHMKHFTHVASSELLNALNGIIIIFCILLQCNVAQNPRHAHSVYLILLLLAGWLVLLCYNLSRTQARGDCGVALFFYTDLILDSCSEVEVAIMPPCNLGIHTFTGRDKPAS